MSVQGCPTLIFMQCLVTLRSSIDNSFNIVFMPSYLRRFRANDASIVHRFGMILSIENMQDIDRQQR
jgi:hypothetical protein